MAALFHSPRLSIRMPDPADAPFFAELMNTPGWLRFIGDRNIQTADDARAYITDRYLQHHADHGFGSYVVTLRENGAPIGVCGLYTRDYLPSPDLGYALLPAYEGHGYALEAADAVLSYTGRNDVLAIVSEANSRSVHILEKLGFTYKDRVRPPGEDREVLLYAFDHNTIKKAQNAPR